jgi:hypothetical protein
VPNHSGDEELVAISETILSIRSACFLSSAEPFCARSLDGGIDRAVTSIVGVDGTQCKLVLSRPNSYTSTRMPMNFVRVRNEII